MSLLPTSEMRIGKRELNPCDTKGCGENWLPAEAESYRRETQAFEGDRL
jgi:hypothetical protein